MDRSIPLKTPNSSRFTKRMNKKPNKVRPEHRRKESASFKKFKAQIKKRKEKFLNKAGKSKVKVKRDKSNSSKFGLRKGSVLSDIYNRHKSINSVSKASSIGSEQDFLNLNLRMSNLNRADIKKGTSSALFTPTTNS